MYQVTEIKFKSSYGPRRKYLLSSFLKINIKPIMDTNEIKLIIKQNRTFS